jgi:hypothetical protein
MGDYPTAPRRPDNKELVLRAPEFSWGKPMDLSLFPMPRSLFLGAVIDKELDYLLRRRPIADAS